MSIKFYNSLSKKKQDFIPIDKNNIGIYVCGPTVYDRAHIGNARAVVIFDVLYDLLSNIYDKVTYVRNITDVDDKINKAASDKNISISELTNQTIKMFHTDMAALNCKNPTIEPKATEHISQMIEMIENLIANNHAYEANNHVLFDVNSYDNYGQLSRRSLDEMIAGSRVEVAPFKNNPHDFVLWKPSSETEPGWDSPWGYGRPGWHIECSAMSTKYLGVNFDIHGGGADLQFPHHENEIAQSCCANKDSSFAKYWLHNGFLTVNGSKMSKSLGNFITIDQLLNEHNVEGEVIRLALLQTHYRKPLDWSDKLVMDAKKTLDNFYNIIKDLPDNKNNEQISDSILDALKDDLNTPLAISKLHMMASDVKKEKNIDEKQKLQKIFLKSANLIGILTKDSQEWLKEDSNDELDFDIDEILQQRKIAKENKDWATADKIRDELLSKNIIIEDGPNGMVKWRKK